MVSIDDPADSGTCQIRLVGNGDTVRRPRPADARTTNQRALVDGQIKAMHCDSIMHAIEYLFVEIDG